MKPKLKVLFIAIWVFVVLNIVLAIVIQIPFVQKEIIAIVAQKVSDKYGFKTSIKKVKFTFPSNIIIENITVFNDTIMIAKVQSIEIGMLNWIKNFTLPSIQKIHVDGLSVNFIKKNESWNFQNSKNIIQQNKTEKSVSKIDISDIQLSNAIINIMDSSQSIFSEIKNVTTGLSINENTIQIKNMQAQLQKVQLINYKDALNKKLSKTKINIDSIQDKLIKECVSILKNNMNLYIVLAQINVQHFEIKDKHKISFEVFNASLNLKKLLKVNTKCNFNIDANAIYMKRKIALKSELQFSKNKLEIKNLEIGVGSNACRINAYCKIEQAKDYKNFLSGTINLLSSSIFLNEMLELLHKPSSQFKLLCNINAAMELRANSIVINKINIDIDNKKLANIGSLVCTQTRNIDSLNIIVKDLNINADSLQIIRFQGLLNNYNQPQLKPFLEKLFYLKLNASAKLNKYNSEISSLIVSNLGTLKISAVFDEFDKIQIYSGNVVFENVNVGSIANNSALHNAFGNLGIEIKMQGNKIDYLRSKILLDSIKGYGNSLNKISISSNFMKSILHGYIESKDDNLQFMSDIKIDMRDTNLIDANIATEIKKIDLHNIKKQLVYSGTSVARVLWNQKIKQLNTTAYFKNNKLTSHRLNLDIENFTANYKISNNHHEADIDFFSIGNINFLGIENVQNMVEFIKQQTSKLLTKTPLLFDSNSNFAFQKNVALHVRLTNINKYKIFFSRSLNLIDNIYADLEYDDNAKDFKLNIKTNRVKNDQIDAYGFNAYVSINNDVIKTVSYLDSLYLFNKMIYKKISLDFYKNRDSGQFNLQSLQENFWVNVNARLQNLALENKTLITMMASDIGIINKKWIINDNSKILFGNKEIDIENIAMQNKNERIYIQSIKNLLSDQISFGCDNVLVGDWVKVFNADINIEAKLSASIILKNYINQELLANAILDEIVSNKDTLGKLQIFIQKKASDLLFDAQLLHSENDIKITNKNLKKDEVLRAEIKKLNLKLLSPYLQDVFNSIEGFANGNLTITKNEEHVEWMGDLFLNQLKLGVLETNCLYEIKPLQVNFVNNKILFNDFKFLDIDKNIGMGKGEVNLDINDMKTFYYNFHINAPNIFAYNTKIDKNDLFYGKVYGNVNLHAYGNIRGDSIKIKLMPISKTEFYFNAGLNKNSNFDKTVVFKKVIKYTDNNHDGTYKKNIVRDILLKIEIEDKNDKPVDFHLIMDKTSNNEMNLKAIPNLKINYSTTENFTLIGNVEVVDGGYDMRISLPGISMKRSFLIDKTIKNFINWSGDPALGEINVKAKYIAKKVNASSLGININSLSATSGYANSASNTAAILTDVDVIANVKGNLSNFDFVFDVNYSENSPIVNDQNFAIMNAYLQNLKSNKSEIAKQASYLIIFNSFANINQNGSNNNNSVNGNLSNTALLSLTNMATNYINNAVMMKKKLFDIGLISNVYNTFQTNDNSTANQNFRSQLGLGFKRTISSRAMLTSDFNLDFALPNSTNTNTTSTTNNLNNVQFLPNVNLAYLMLNTETFKLNANLFCRSFYDNLNKGAKYKTGISLSLNKEFVKSNKK